MQKKNVYCILLIEEEIHRTAEVGRDVWRSPHPPSCSQQAQPEQAAQGCVQLASEYLQGWRLNGVAGQPVEKKCLCYLAAVSLNTEMLLC